MKPTFHEITISSITVRERLRAIDPVWVEVLAKSIAAIGLEHPITLIKETDGSHTLLAGAHRLAAVQSLKWGEIPAQVIEAAWVKDRERRLHEILENLMRNELTKLDRAASLSELKDAHELLYPQTKHGQHGGRGGKKNETAIFAFSKTTAEKTGLSERAIRLAVAIWRGLNPNAAAALTVRGDSMEPTIRDGDTLLLDTSVDRVKDNGIYVVVIDGLVVVKRVHMSRDGTVTLISDNQLYPPEEVPAAEVPEIRFAGRVMWFGRSI